VLLGDSDIEVLVRYFALKNIESRACGHRGGDSHNPRFALTISTSALPKIVVYEGFASDLLGDFR